MVLENPVLSKATGTVAFGFLSREFKECNSQTMEGEFSRNIYCGFIGGGLRGQKEALRCSRIESWQ